MTRGKYDGFLSRGRKAMATSGSRTEFLAMDNLGSASDIQYGRTGGWFVTKRRAIQIGLAFVVALILVGLLVHYFGGSPQAKKINAAGTGVMPPNTGSGITTPPPIPPEKLRLPKDVIPLRYQLKLDPYLDETDPQGKNFTYHGTVTIVLQCDRGTDKITLHSKRLELGDNITLIVHQEPVYHDNNNASVVVTTPAIKNVEVAGTLKPEVSDDSIASQPTTPTKQPVPTPGDGANIPAGNSTPIKVTSVNQTAIKVTTLNSTAVKVAINSTAYNITHGNPSGGNITNGNSTAVHVAYGNLTHASVKVVNLTNSKVISGNATHDSVATVNVTNVNIPLGNSTPATVPPGNSTPATVPPGNTTPATVPSGNSTPAKVSPVTSTNADGTPANSTDHARSKRTPVNMHHRRKPRHDPPTTTTLSPDTPPFVSRRDIEEKTETVTFTVVPPLKAGQKYELTIPFTGLLRGDKLFGFYASKYQDDNNVTRWMATTQFEAPHAREAFPCFDEPAMKAEFEISVSRNVNMTTMSNMPIRVTEPIKDKPDRVWDHYKISPIMPTYLVIFIVAPSDFVSTNDTMAEYLKGKGTNATGPEFKIFARAPLMKSATYAATIGPKILDFYQDYFRMEYPLPKLHMAAIPDFAVGGMENWGLITYRELYLMYDAETSSVTDKDHVAIVVAHEISHQWFGNLVTMKWWSDLWLNEGFATYMQYLGSDHVEPELKMMDKFVVMEQHMVMKQDSLKSTHPISSDVANPEQISQVFDFISYKKGAALIRMLNNSISESVLRKGLQRYLVKWKFNNANESDLWEALTEENNASSESTLPGNGTVKAFMDTWTLQNGYPVLTVIRDYEKGSAIITQSRFTLENLTSDSLWYIPVSYVTQEEKNNGTNSSKRTFPRIWLQNEKSKVIEHLSKPNSSSWVLFNIDATGYYRVNYDEKNWALLTSQLKSPDMGTKFFPVTRAQLIDDVMNLANAGHVNYEVALNLTAYLPAERDFVPWTSAITNFGFLKKMLRATPAYGTLLDYLFEMMTPVKNYLGYEIKPKDTHNEKMLRASILGFLSTAGHHDLEQWAQNLFNKWRNSSDPDKENPVPVDLRKVVYCATVAVGGRSEWHFVLERFKAAETKPAERMVLLESLTCTKEAWLLITLLEMSLERDGTIRRQDAFKVWRSVPGCFIGSRVAFNYVRNNWDSIYEEFGKDEYLLGDIIKGALSGLTSELDLKDAREFHEKNQGKFNFAQSKMSQEMESLERRVDWNKKYYQTIVTWLQENTVLIAKPKSTEGS